MLLYRRTNDDDGDGDDGDDDDEEDEDEDENRLSYPAADAGFQSSLLRHDDNDDKLMVMLCNQVM